MKSSELRLARSHNFTGTSRSGGNWFGGDVASVIETCAEASTTVTAGTTSKTSSLRKLPDCTLASARCALRYAEFAYGSSTASVKRFPAASFRSERTSAVICPAVLYADDPTTGIIPSSEEARRYPAAHPLLAAATASDTPQPQRRRS